VGVAPTKNTTYNVHKSQQITSVQIAFRPVPIRYCSSSEIIPTDPTSHQMRVDVLPSDSTACALASFTQTQSHHAHGAFPQPIAESLAFTRPKTYDVPTGQSIRRCQRSDLRQSFRTISVGGSAQNRDDLTRVTCYFTHERTQ